VPADGEGGTHTFKLRVYDALRPQNAEESGAIAVKVTPKVAPTPTPKPVDETKGINWKLIIAAGVGGLILIGGIVTAVLMMGDKVPDVVNLELKAAEEKLAKEDLKLGTVTEEAAEEVASGHVIRTVPAKGESVPENKTVDVVISPVSNGVPRVLALTRGAAEAKLTAAGFTVGEVTTKVTGESTGGTVIEQTPEAGARALPQTPVALTIEKSRVIVPPLQGESIADAVAELERLGLARGATETTQTGATALTIVGSRPAAGETVDAGTAIDLLVEGQKTAVPGVVNLSLSQATNSITARGLKVAAVSHDRSNANARMDTVKSQEPAPNAEVAPGSDVRLVVWGQPIRRADLVAAAGVVFQRQKNLQADVRDHRRRGLATPISPSRCKKGFVYRLAFEGDHVCVTLATRQQVVADNDTAKERVEPDARLHAYGPATCRQGFVWREARDGDLVCVTPAIRTQTREDNQLAATRQTGV
jgi:beta-lactam-binding protein with PASTA domain